MEQLRPVCGSGCVSARGCGPMRPPTLLAATMLHERDAGIIPIINR